MALILGGLSVLLLGKLSYSFEAPINPRVLKENLEIDFNQYNYLSSQLLDAGLIRSAYLRADEVNYPEAPLLSLKGWEEFYKLSNNPTDSKQVFMAMKFGPPDFSVEIALRECFRPAIESLGFDLKRVDEDQPSGLIDDHIIADLTTHNQGVYWEAGYAYALGKKVIYTCHEDDFNATHFDTSHHKIIKWSENSFEKTKKDIVATVEANLTL